MPTQDDVTLKVNGSLYSGWTSVSIKRSLKAISGSFDLSVADKWSEDKAAWQIVPGDESIVTIGADTLITGYVDRVSPSFSENSRSISVRGRDTSCDLVDCSAIFNPGVWSNVTFKYLLKVFCSQFDVGLTIDPSAATAAAKVFYVAKLQPAESAFEFLERYARLSGVLLTNDSQGNVLVTLAGSSRASNDLIQGQNIKSARADYDNSERFSNYTVKCQGSVGDGQDPGIQFTTQGIAADDLIDRYRPKIIQAENVADTATCTKRAQWESKIRAARASRVSVTLQGWRQKNGQLWQLNQISRVKSNWLGIDLDYLITDTTFTKSESGTETELGLERPDAYTIDPTLRDKNDPLPQLVVQDKNR
jgi:prophage tail gpP-like protein